MRSQKAEKLRPSLVLLSANTEPSLEQSISQSLNYVHTHPQGCANFAYTMARGRDHRVYRSFLLAGDGSEADKASVQKAPSRPLEIIMTFTGQGAQWPEMGVGLLDTNLGFKEDLKTMDRVLQTLNYPPNWTIEGRWQRLIIITLLTPLRGIKKAARIEPLARSRIRSAHMHGNSDRTCQSPQTAWYQSKSRGRTLQR